MILPEDSKGPALAHADQKQPHPQDVPTYSGHPAPPYTETQPLLRNVPNVPYEHTHQRQRPGWRSYRRQAVWIGFGLVCAVLTWVTVKGPSPGPVHSRPGGPGDHGDHGPGSRPDSPPPQHGQPVQCASFDGKEGHWVAGSLGGFKTFSQNVSFAISLEADELFVHLLGADAIGPIFVDTYDSDFAGLDHQNDGALEASRYSGKSNMRVIVEPTVTLQEWEHELEGSIGLNRLLAAQVCEMERRGEHIESRHQHRTAVRGGQGRGVGVYGHHVEDEPNDRPTGRWVTPLQYRIFVSIPSAAHLRGGNAASGEGRIDTTGRFTYVPALELRATAGEIEFSDMSSITFGELYAKTEVGQLMLGDVKAERIKMITQAGKVVGDAAVSESLDVSTQTGDIELDVTLAVPATGSRRMTRSKAKQNPIKVNLNTQSGDVAVRYTGWEDPSLTLSQHAHSAVGQVKVTAHPLFEGDLHFASQIGSIAVDLPDEPVEDPTGKGRTRIIQLRKHDGWGSKLWDGTVRWTKQDEALAAKHPAVAEPKDDQPGMSVKTEVGSIKVVF